MGSGSSTAQTYRASCHCGALSAQYRTALAPAQWTVRACQCSFCRAHAALTASDPTGSLLFACGDRERLQCYQFGSRSTDFLVCRECGVYIGATIVHAGGGFGVLNVRTLQPVPAQLPAAVPMDYNVETAESKRERRTQRWTPLEPGSV